MNFLKRRIGLEQEFFIVDETGALTESADEFLQCCHEIAVENNRSPEYFVTEFVKSMVEINTPPCKSGMELAREYLQNLQIAVTAGKKMGLRLYPLSSYPLHIMPVIRDKLNYHIQARTVGYERFLHAGKCTGTHIHLEVSPGVISDRVAVSYNSTVAEREELLNIYNLATALDSALISLARACPFYEGQAIGLASHTIRYRGSEKFGWEGVYTHLQPVGGLMPYAHCVEGLVEQQFARFYAWLEAMDKAGVERHLFFDGGGSLLKSAWNPIRLNKLGTVEIRCIDSNYPSVILAVILLIENAARRVRYEKLKVRPAKGLQVFELDGQSLWVPDFEYLNGDLLYAAATEGVKHPKVKSYLDSILEFAIIEGSKEGKYLVEMREKLDNYTTIETEILQKFSPTVAELSQEEGLRLVRDACDKLEQELSLLDRKDVFIFPSSLSTSGSPN
ncbi:glutamate-cysteine ligase family protein [Calothrix sp. UHCC 0171]|uniref:glutamate-cysteine ligase family protein n=1 Tax=Calothrix sp. UHCC 0171 TaxID=3110245 RepID=UPI002B1EA485|nr:glutamate-cysteine ligase family protein [Calothrix sp. UHCC 0171]MEA5572679.1 glutamate-cysteine ligase family protein [Calothrix sp. UHCC 0171]